MSEKFDETKFMRAGINAIRKSMDIIAPYLTKDKTIGESKIKEEDKTLLTIVDSESEKALYEELREAFPATPIVREEGGLSKGISDGSEDYIILGDPVDGTAALVGGVPTSTIICSVYSKSKKQIIATVIGEPSYRRIWFVMPGTGCFLAKCTKITGITEYIHCKVWDGEYNPKSLVFLDPSPGFTRKGRTILSDQEVRSLFCELYGKVNVFLCGSNGEHHALVANGCERVAGAITQAIGGPWDVSGALLVKQAGGICAAFTMTEDRRLVEKDPLDIMDYDILVSANNERTLAFLCECLRRSIRRIMP